MPKLQYVGQSHFREISAADFKRVGADGQGKIRVARSDIFPEHNPDNVPTEVEVSDEAAGWLLANEAADWKTVEPDASASKSTDSASGASSGSKK